MSTPIGPPYCCPTIQGYGQHTTKCEANNAKVRAELGEPASGRYWIGKPLETKEGRE